MDEKCFGGIYGKEYPCCAGGGRSGGNTAQLAESFAKGAVENGHNVELISLAIYNVGKNTASAKGISVRKKYLRHS